MDRGCGGVEGLFSWSHAPADKAPRLAVMTCGVRGDMRDEYTSCYGASCNICRGIDVGNRLVIMKRNCKASIPSFALAVNQSFVKLFGVGLS